MPQAPKGGALAEIARPIALNGQPEELRPSQRLADVGYWWVCKNSNLGPAD
jgi:hypothetical protein